MRRRSIGASAVVVGLITTGCAVDEPDRESAPPTTEPAEPEDGHEHDDSGIDPAVLIPAYLGTAPYQDVEAAEADGWVGTVETLGCFENPGTGGMGVHWLNESLLDGEVDAALPEALVYELGADGEVAGLVGHEYLVPLEAWTAEEPPTLFGLDFHPHPVLPFWILHAYLWKDNPAGMFADWNPAIRMCPDGVIVFGEDAGSDTDDGEPATDEQAGPATDRLAAPVVGPS